MKMGYDSLKTLTLSMHAVHERHQDSLSEARCGQGKEDAIKMGYDSPKTSAQSMM